MMTLATTEDTVDTEGQPQLVFNSAYWASFVLENGKDHGI